MLVAVALVSTVVVLALPTGLAEVPLRATAWASVLLLAPLLGGIGFSVMLGCPWRELEACLPRRALTVARLTWYVSGTLVLTLLPLGAIAARLSDPALAMAVARNSVLGLAVGAASACCLPRSTAWIPPTLLAACCWLMGTVDISGAPRPWAIPFYSADSTVAVVVTALTWLGSGTWYVWRDGVQIR